MIVIIRHARYEEHFLMCHMLDDALTKCDAINPRLRCAIPKHLQLDTLHKVRLILLHVYTVCCAGEVLCYVFFVRIVRLVSQSVVLLD